MAAKPKKNLQRKDGNINSANTIAYVQILGTGMDTQDTSPSVLLFFDKQRFIFNAGEGLQRFCAEHKIKLSKIDHICLSRVCSETAGGLPGLLLTLAGIGEGLSVNIWGPPNLGLLVDAMKCFIPHDAMVRACPFSATSKFTEPIKFFESKIVNISAVLFQPSNVEGDAVKPCDISVIYICELPEIMGRFSEEKAEALGLKDKRKRKELQRGESVKSDSLDIMIHPGDVMGPSVPGPIVLIVDCPTISHAQALSSIQSLGGYYSDFSGNSPQPAKTVNCVIHLTPASVSSDSSYVKWMEKFGSAQHIMAGHAMNHVGVPILKSSARIAARLNYLCPSLFPASALWSLQQTSNAAPGSMVSNKDPVSELCKSTLAENLTKFTLRPHAHLGLDNSNVPPLITSSEVITELLGEIPEIEDAAKQVSKLWHMPVEDKKDMPDNELITEEPSCDKNNLPSCLENIRRDDLEIVFLGTGSSQPSKYRNVSSIYVNLFSRGSLLLDCGEGTLAQLKRRYGMEGAASAVRNLRCIWISHIHADHHAGLVRILSLRSSLLKGATHEPLIVIGPRQLQRFLEAYRKLEDLDMQFLDCRSTTEASWDAFESEIQSNKRDEDMNTEQKSSNKRMKLTTLVDNDADFSLLNSLKKVLQDAGLESLISFPVIHCPESFGLVLKAADRFNNAEKLIPGWKIVYSGDTRPLPRMIDSSHGATLLIHEATFDDQLIGEAIARNHSTTTEAIEVGHSIDAYRVILTHFSQRYPKIPTISDSGMQKTGIAFDLMSINIADLPQLPHITPYLKQLFKNEMTIDDI